MNTNKINLWVIRALLAFVCIAGVSPVFAESATTQELAAQKELLQLQIDNVKQNQQKDSDALTKRIDDQISTTGQKLDSFGIVTSYLGILITVILAAAGLVGYLSVVSKAREEARNASKKWFDDNAQAAQNKISDLEARLTEALNRISQLVDSVETTSQQANAKINEKAQASLTKNNPIDVSTQQEIVLAAHELEHKAQSSYSYDDWNTRAFAAYNEGKNVLAAEFWGQSANIPNVGAAKAVQSLFNKGAVLGQTYEAIKVYDSIITQYGEDNEADVREQVAAALLNKGVTLSKLGQSDDAINVYDSIISKYGADSNVDMRELVAKAFTNKAVNLSRLGQIDEAIKVYDSLIAQYGADSDFGVREKVAGAMLNKAVTLSKLGQSNESIMIYESLIAQYIADKDAGVREMVAKAMVNKGLTFERLGQSDEAIKIYDSLIAQYGADKESGVREQVGSAYNGKGFKQLCQVKENWISQAAKEQLLPEAHRLFNEAQKYSRDSAVILGNQAYSAWLSGNSDEAETLFRSALTAAGGGESIYSATLGDFDIHPIPEDEGFRQLVERLFEEYKQTLG